MIPAADRSATRVAAVVLLREDGAALMQHRDDKPGLARAGMWVMPGGHCEPGEDPEDCARREMHEETDYRCGELRLLAHLTDRNDVTGEDHELIVFVAKYDGNQPYQCLEGQDLRFIRRADAGRYAIPDILLRVWDSSIERFLGNSSSPLEAFVDRQDNTLPTAGANPDDCDEPIRIVSGDRSDEEVFDITIFVPCYNEERHVAGTLSTIRDAANQLELTCEVQVVDDGSTDRTSEMVREFQDENPEMKIHLHRNPVNLGLAHSYVDTAFRGRGSYYALVWGDGGWTRETMVSILRHAGKADLIIPFVVELECKPWSRRLLSRIYTTLVNVLSGNRLKYYNGGLVCRRYDALRWAPRCAGFSGFLAELITVLLELGATKLEVPIKGKHIVKAKQDSVVTWSNLFSTGHSLLNIALRRMRRMLFGNPYKQVARIDCFNGSWPIDSRSKAVERRSFDSESGADCKAA